MRPRVMYCCLVIFSIVVLSGVGSIPSSADPLDNWHWRNPMPTGDDLYDIAYGKNTFVAVGGIGKGAILTSYDGITWMQRDSGSSGGGIACIAYGNNIFVALQDDGVLTSANGITWKRSAFAMPYITKDAAYGNGIFVAVGFDGVVLTSSDGLVWTQRTTSSTANLSAVTYGNNTFVAVGEGGTILTSPDGITWTQRVWGSSDSLSAIAYGNSIFVAMGESGIVVASPDGGEWTVQNNYVLPFPRSIVYDGSNFVAVGSFDGFGAILASSNGISWTQTYPGINDSPVYVPAYGIAYGNDLLVAVGGGGTILTSTDGDSWIERSAVTHSSLSAVIYGNDLFVAVGVNGAVFSSPDGVTWTRRLIDTEDPSVYNYLHLFGAVYGNSTFVAFGQMGTVLTSTDGINWIPRTTEAYLGFYGMAYGLGTFVAVGTQGVFTSPDGISWSLRDTTPMLTGVAYCNDLFLITGYGGVFLTSPDGINWTPHPVNSSPTPVRTTCLNDAFTIIGDGFLSTSPDGAAWTNHSISYKDWLESIIYVNDTYVALGLYDILTSSDGMNWSVRFTNNSTLLHSIAYGNNSFVIAGNHGALLQSDPLGFSDVPSGSWAERFVIKLVGSGVSAGCGNGNFCPDAPVTRSQMAVLLLSALGHSPSGTCSETVFPDVNIAAVGDETCRYIEKLSALGITAGCGNGLFCPDEPVSRAQMAVLITKALDETAATCTGSIFSDVNGSVMPEGFWRYIEKFSTLGITAGCLADDPQTPQNEAMYCPETDVTRAQMAVFLTKGFLR